MEHRGLIILNTIAIFYGSLAAIPFGTMVVVFVIWAFISFPLALLGTLVGRNWSGAPNNPCRAKTILHLIPEKKWYLTPSVVSIMAGLLPFGSIFIEMYFVFTSFLNYKKQNGGWYQVRVSDGILHEPLPKILEADLEAFINTDLKNLRKLLHAAAEYFELSYTSNDKKQLGPNCKEV